MTAPIYLNSEDDSAPVISPATLGTMVDFFQAVLVDGYGTKAGLGWTMPYKNTAGTIACFKNDAGWYFQVDNSALDTSYRTFKVHLFESMISETVGFGRVPDEDFYMTTGWSDGQRWKIIGDSKGFWFLITKMMTGDYPYHFYPFYVGEYIPFHQDNVFNQCIFGSFPKNVQWGTDNYYNSSVYNVESSPETSPYRFLSVARLPLDYDPKFSYCEIMYRSFFTTSLFQSYNSSSYPSKKVGNHRLFSPTYMARSTLLLGQLPGFWFPYFYEDEGLQPETIYNVGALKLLRVHKIGNSTDTTYDQMAFDLGTQFRTLGVR